MGVQQKINMCCFFSFQCYFVFLGVPWLLGDSQENVVYFWGSNSWSDPKGWKRPADLSPWIPLKRCAFDVPCWVERWDTVACVDTSAKENKSGKQSVKHRPGSTKGRHAAFVPVESKISCWHIPRCRSVWAKSMLLLLQRVAEYLSLDFKVATLCQYVLRTTRPDCLTFDLVLFEASGKNDFGQLGTGDEDCHSNFKSWCHETQHKLLMFLCRKIEHFLRSFPSC